jgi:hypothetical protein
MEHHEQVTLSHVLEFEDGIREKWDAYSRYNDKACVNRILNLISPKLNEELKLRMLATDTAAVLWMRVMKLVVDGSSERYNRQKDALRALSPLLEPGQNILILRKGPLHLQQTVACLPVGVASHAGHCPADLSCHCRSVSLDVSSHQDVNRSYFDRNLVPGQRPSYLGHGQKRIPLHSVLTLVEDTYKSLLDNKDWPPATNQEETQGAPTAFLAGMTEVQLNALVQSCVDKKLLVNRSRLTTLSVPQRAVSTLPRVKPPMIACLLAVASLLIMPQILCMLNIRSLSLLTRPYRQNTVSRQ